MKSSIKSRIFILITLGILFTFSTIISTHLGFIMGINNKNSDYRDVLKFKNKNLKISAVSGKIHIINNSGWVAFRNDGNCTGSGTYSDPYVIEDLVIDSGGSGNCILIENSDVYFKIENCALYNSVAGIKLLNVNNSQIINNNCSFNFRGIYLEYSNNNNLSGNTVSNNTYGIYLSYSNNNNLSGNTVSNNTYGIYLRDSYNNNLLGNTANNNHYGKLLRYSNNNNLLGNIINNNSYGIFLNGGEYNKLSGNTANNNLYGIYLDGGEYNKISVNFLINNRFGIRLGYYNSFSTLSGNIMNGCGLSVYGPNTFEELCSHDIDTTNLVNGKHLYYYKNELNLGFDNFLNAGQVILVNVNDSIVSNLMMLLLYGSSGISLYYSNNNIISGNIIIKNFEDGIYLEYSHNNKISKNYITYNDHGIHLRESNNNVISGNIVNKNFDDGITDRPFIMNCHNNTITNNIVQNNGGNGLSLRGDNNIITKNKVNHNAQNGVRLGGDNNIISENEINDNYEYGIYLVGENNKIYLNCFYNHLFNAIDDGRNNDWDSGSTGNYWDVWDHPSFDEDSDGIVDIPCPIPGSARSQDNFPLMKCPISAQDDGGIPIELIVLISGGAVLGIATLLLIIRKRKRV